MSMTQQEREDISRWNKYQLTGKSVKHFVVTKWLKKLAQGKTAQCPK
jgi:hypothetical protein